MESGTLPFKFAFLECKVQKWLGVSICATFDLAASFNSGPILAIGTAVGKSATILLSTESN